MIRLNENGRASAEANVTPVAPEQRVSTAPSASLQSSWFPRPMGASPRLQTGAELDELFPAGQFLDALRTGEASATDGAHVCESTRDYWTLAAEDVPAYEAGGEPHWTIQPLCLFCVTALRASGALCQVTARIDDPYVVAEVTGDC